MTWKTRLASAILPLASTIHPHLLLSLFPLLSNTLVRSIHFHSILLRGEKAILCPSLSLSHSHSTLPLSTYVNVWMNVISVWFILCNCILYISWFTHFSYTSNTYLNLNYVSHPLLVLHEMKNHISNANKNNEKIIFDNSSLLCGSSVLF